MAKRTPSASTARRTSTHPTSSSPARSTRGRKKATRAAAPHHPELHVREGKQPVYHAHPAHAGVVLPRVKKRRSKFAGWGVYAVDPINKNRRIIAYTGEKIAHKESLEREARYLENGEIWCFKLNNRWVIDASVGGNDARFINHACKPNCYTQIIDGVIWVRAGRAIAAGEELTYNYYTEGEAEIPCKCRPGCKGML